MLLRTSHRRARARHELDTDLAIVGAGCAGLSLAYRLLEHDLNGRRMLLLDPRSSYGRDRTWCFWNVAPHPFADLVTHRWRNWRVRAGGGWIERSAPGLHYQLLPSDAFYRRALDRLEQRGVEVRLGTQIVALREMERSVACLTESGEIEAGLAFDSRPVRLTPIVEPGREITLLQHFQGWHVRTTRQVFDPEMVTLMDFDVPQEHGLAFMYVLPFAGDEALLEATWFSASLVDEAVYHRTITDYLRALDPGEWTVLAREEGVIPMTTRRPITRPSERIYRLGLAGGLAKPSTGYAFQPIQRFSAAFADRIARHELPEPPAIRPRLSLFTDRIFLSHLARHPHEGPTLFARLFERVPPDVLVRFLSDVASPADRVRVMRELPFAPLTIEALRSPRLWV